jgi:ketosteroid isomerase-like protein
VNLEASVRALADREAIRDLARRYAHAVWQKDAAGAIALFADDGEMDTGDRPPIRGRQALLDAYQTMFAKDEFHPMIHNHVIDFEAGDTRSASGTCYLDLEAVVDGVAMIGTGVYRDRYVRVGDEWKFRSRKLSMGSFVEADRMSPSP